MEDSRKKWTQPQLIILGRGAPEENVLAGCKMSTNVMKGPSATRTACKKKASGTPCKTACSALSTTS